MFFACNADSVSQKTEASKSENTHVEVRCCKHGFSMIFSVVLRQVFRFRLQTTQNCSELRMLYRINRESNSPWYFSTWNGIPHFTASPFPRVLVTIQRHSENSPQKPISRFTASPFQEFLSRFQVILKTFHANLPCSLPFLR